MELEQIKNSNGEKMKRTIKLAVVAALALGTTSAFATNGDAMIGVGAKAIGMGGVGIGISCKNDESNQRTDHKDTH